ncbi:MAG TPA: SRPBCC family protein [Actinophytocola sp.]|nr:SRPBCC family protein [Actinophytocola sp.]
MTNQDTAGTVEAMNADPGTCRIRFSRRLPHSAAAVWSALAEPVQQQRWLPGVTIEASEGGAVTFDFGEDEKAEGAVLALEPGRLIEHTWLWPDEPESTVRWELTSGDEQTTLSLCHEPVRPGPAAGFGAGWHATLDALAVHLTGGDPAELTPDHEALHALYDVN